MPTGKILAAIITDGHLTLQDAGKKQRRWSFGRPVPLRCPCRWLAGWLRGRTARAPTPSHRPCSRRLLFFLLVVVVPRRQCAARPRGGACGGCPRRSPAPRPVLDTPPRTPPSGGKQPTSHRRHRRRYRWCYQCWCWCSFPFSSLRRWLLARGAAPMHAAGAIRWPQGCPRRRPPRSPLLVTAPAPRTHGTVVSP